MDFIAEQKPSLKGAAAKGIASKMKTTSAGFIKNLAMETVSGIPFGANVVDWMGEKMSGFGESITQGKKLSETELGVAAAFKGGGEPDEGEPDPSDPEPNGEPEPTPPGGDGLSGVVQSLNRIEALLTTGLFGSPPFLQTISETLGDMLKVTTPDAEAGREAERELSLIHI